MVRRGVPRAGTDGLFARSGYMSARRLFRVSSAAIVPFMEPSPREELLRLFRQTLAQCRDTQNFWRGHDFRLHVGGMDITEAERAASEERIKHLENLIATMERENGET